MSLLIILSICLSFKAPSWLTGASWSLITPMRGNKIDQKEFVSSCCDDRVSHLIRKAAGINWLVLHLLLWSNGVWGKPEQLKAEFFYLSSIPPRLPSSSVPALVQLCICILNDSITQDPAVKIMDVFHYFSPLGHGDPSGAPIKPPLLLFPSISFSPPVFFSFLSLSPVFFFLINILLPFRDWEEIIAKWSCLCTLGMASWQKRFLGNSSVATTQQAAEKRPLRQTVVQIQTAVKEK